MSKKLLVHAKTQNKAVGWEPVEATISSNNTHRKNIRQKLFIFVFAAIAIISLIFNTEQYRTINNLNVQVNELQDKYDNMAARKNQAVKEANNLRTDLNHANENIDKLTEFGKQSYNDLNWYRNNVALITNYNGECAYHTISCHHLGDTFYGMTVTEALRRGCWSCSDCH